VCVFVFFFVRRGKVGGAVQVVGTCTLDIELSTLKRARWL
jgi:hypothetical protein